ncbi:tail protein [Sorangium cellulosum]|uniref:Tail protein n=1 Tax=Sorangium cellulosum TaxID=56 RepID=A0A2L0ESW9_SORCE|nr:tail fiber protein [Sorangium cellulosum]AUX42389.1 tail protein [Sorangium cellulosum]
MTPQTEKKMPFGFKVSYELFNARGERLENVLLIEKLGSGQALQLDVLNILTDATILLRQRTSAGEGGGAHHFRLRFPAGALASRETRVEGADWDVKRIDRQDGTTDLYLAWCSPDVQIAPGDGLVVLLQGVSATPDAGAEVVLSLSWPKIAVVESFAAANVFPLNLRGPGQGGDYLLEDTLRLGVRDRRGRPDIPLRVRFDGPSRVLNVDNQTNTLTLRLVNSASPRSQQKLRFVYDANQPERTSRLVVALPVGTSAAQPWALGTKDQLNGVSVALAGWTASGPTESADGDLLEWVLSPGSAVELAPQESLTLTLSNLATLHPSGTADLELRYSAVPGYWDGEILCPIEKAPLVFGRGDERDRIGIGGNAPDARLYVRNGDLLLDSGQLQNTGPLRFRSDTNGTGENQVAQFFKKDEEEPLMELLSDGKMRLGVGTPTAPGKLTLHGTSGVNNEPVLWADARTGSQARVELPGDVQLRERATSNLAYLQACDDSSARDIGLVLRTQKGSQRVDALRLTPEGRAKDKTGFLVPVGTIVAYGGSTAPDGWLLCNGAVYKRANYQDLFNVIGTTYNSNASETVGGDEFRVPTLLGRVPVGHMAGGYARTLGALGGEAEHTLTIDEMPVHDHGVNDPGHSHRSPVYHGSGDDNRHSDGDEGDRDGWSPTESSTTGISIQNSGGGRAHNNMQPYLVVNYIIKH